MGEEEATTALQEIFEERRLLVDQPLRVAVVAHGDRQVHPGAARDQIRREDDRPTGGGDLRETEPGRVAVGAVQAVVGAEGLGALAPGDLEPTGRLEQPGQLRDERRAVP